MLFIVGHCSLCLWLLIVALFKSVPFKICVILFEGDAFILFTLFSLICPTQEYLAMSVPFFFGVVFAGLAVPKFPPLYRHNNQWIKVFSYCEGDTFIIFALFNSTFIFSIICQTLDNHAMSVPSSLDQYCVCSFPLLYSQNKQHFLSEPHKLQHTVLSTIGCRL